MRKYYYKKYNYGQAVEAWLVKNPDLKESLYEVFHLPDDYDWNQTSKELSDCIAISGLVNKSFPRLEYETIKPGVVWLDLVTGAPTAVKLLLHVPCPHKCPDNPIRDIIASHKAKHKNRGPYHHMIKVNIYCSEMSLWNSHFKTLEVDLWQDIMVEKLLESIKGALAEVRTCVQVPKVYRYCVSTRTM